MFTKDKIIEIREYLDKVEPNTKVYLGGDSIKKKIKGEWWADYVVVLMVHLGQKHGGKVFSYQERERIYDKEPNKPRLRLMTETYKIVECYLELKGMLDEFDAEGLLEVHLDLNNKPEFPSNAVVKQAVGYVMGITGLPREMVKIKPESQIASHCADHGAKYGGHQDRFGGNRNSKPMKAM